MSDHDDAKARNLKWTANLTDTFPSGHSPLDAIRRKCIDCCCGLIGEISACEMRDCALWPYRMGKNPFHARSGKPTGRPFGARVAAE